MLKIILLDNEPQARDTLSLMVATCCEGASLVGAYGNVADTVAAIREKNPDILLLDIELNNESGFDIFKHFPEPGFKVIFVTAFEQYAVQAFRFAALDYLLKPVNPLHLEKAVSKVAGLLHQENMSLRIESFLHNMKHSSRESKKIVLRTADTIHLVNLRDIQYCEASSGYTSFHLSDKTRIVVSSTLGDYEALLEEFQFVRIHQSYLVNMDYARRFEKNHSRLILEGDQALPVATRKKDLLMDILSRL